VSGPISLWKARHRESSFLSCAVLLFAVVVVSLTLAVPFAYLWGGGEGIASLALAASINLTLGFASLAVMLFFVHQNRALEGTLVSMAMRMTPPLVLAVWLATTAPAQDNILLISSLIYTYLVVLAVETWLSVRAAKINNSHQ
jgi:hypothetical protein